MRKTINYGIPLLCLVLFLFLYDRQLGAAPLLVLSGYLFYIGWKQLDRRKKKSR